MEWRLLLTSEATRDFRELDEAVKSRISGKLEWLRANFNTITPISLGGSWQGYFKIRVGDWRIIYKIDWDRSSIIVCVIGRRDKVYKL